MLVLVLCGHRMNAQVDFSGDWNALFANVRLQSAIRHSCLWEYGCTDTFLLRYHGTDKDDTASFEQWSDLYEHWSNSVMDSLYMPPNKANLISWFNVYLKRGVTVVPALLAEGASIRKDAFESGRLLLDSIHPDIFVVDPANAFEDRNVFMAAPFVQNFFEPVQRFVFSDSFFFSNTGLNVTRIAYKINDEPFQEAMFNSEVSIPLKAGFNVLTVQFILSNGIIFKSKSRLLYYEKHASFGNEQLMTPLIGDEFRNIYTEPYRVTETQEPLGAYIEVLPGFENGVAHSCIKKPLIFVEGIDFGYKDHPTGCYGGKCGSMGLRDLLRGEIYHPYETKIKDIMESWGPIAKAPQLIDKLRKAGYDLIYLDFHNGADYIENNAMLLVELIKRVNFIKCSKEEISVIGASMGGLVTRFALMYMEKHNIPHCVRTFVSFDAPQNGANIPLGMQHCLKYYRKKLPGIRDKFDRKLDRAASRQMLLLHCLSENGYKEHGDRIDFVSKLGGLGLSGAFPVNCRKIAVVNGSINAQGQDFIAGDKLLEMNPYLGQFNFDFLEVSCKVYASYAQVEGRNVVLIAQFPFKKKLVVDVPFDIPQVDHIPGALRYDLEETRAIYGLFNVINKEDATCFIPSYSALGMNKNEIFTDFLGQIPRERPLPGKHPFDAYYGEISAQEHMMLTDGNIDWILEQLESNKNELQLDLNTDYNFGRRQRTIVSDINVVNGGRLAVNCKGRTGFGNGRYDQVNQYGSEYDLYSSDCGPFIRIWNGGKVEIGASENDGGNIGRFHVRKGSVIEFLPGSTLIIHDFSELIIEEGGELILHENVQLMLNGANAKIRIDGRLRLKENSILAIVASPGFVKGFLHFRNIGGGYGASSVIVEGSNTKIKLEGSGSQYTLMQIEGVITFGIQQPLSEFQLKKGAITYGDNSSLIVNGNTYIEQVDFKHLSWASLKLNNCMKIGNFDECKIVNSVYSNFNIGITFECNHQQSIVEVRNSKFIGCNNGIFADVANVKLFNCVFDRHSENAVYGQKSLKQLQINTCQFTRNSVGLRLEGVDDPLLLFVEDVNWEGNRIACDLRQVKSVMKCSRFIGNEIGISAALSEINLSELHELQGYGIKSSGGNNTFIQFNGPALSLNLCNLMIEGGFNNFIYKGKSKQMNLIKGQVVYSIDTHEGQAPYKLLGSDNYWYPVPKNGLEQSSSSLYSLVFDDPGGSRQVQYIQGDVLNELNTLCYEEGGCNPCNIAEDSGDNIIYTFEEAGNRILTFPQPATEVLHIQSEDSVVLKLSLLTLDGRIIISEVIASNGRIDLEVSDLATGLYFLQIRRDDHIEWRPVIVRH